MDASATPIELHNARRILAGAERATDRYARAAWADELADTLALARAVLSGLAVPTEAGTRALTAGRLAAAHLARYGITCPTADDHECLCETVTYPARTA